MYCKSCGAVLPEGAGFCPVCGTAAPRPTPGAYPGTPPPPPPGRPPSGGQGGDDRKWLWTAIAVLVVVIVAVAVTIPLLLYRAGDDEVVTETTAAPTTTTRPRPQTTTSRTKPTAPPTTEAPETLPGDSDGYWAEIDPLAPYDLRDEPFMTAVSDECLALLMRDGDSYRLHVHDFASRSLKTIAAPAEGEIYDLAIDKNMIVWWQGRFDEESGGYVDQHIYSYDYPDGPLVEVAGSRPHVAYPQIAGIWVTWVEGGPWQEDPDSFWRVPIYGAFTSTAPGSANEPQLLVPHAVTSLMGDADWTYSLGETHLAWEQWVEEGGLAIGSYVIDLLTLDSKPLFLGATAWRPSVSAEKVVYWDENQGLSYLALDSGGRVTLDERGDFGIAAPTYVAYFRAIEDSTGPSYEIVARGYTGAHEQVLTGQWDPPWFSTPISTSGRHVAFIADSVLRVFEWRPGAAPRSSSADEQGPPATPLQAY